MYLFDLICCDSMLTQDKSKLNNKSLNFHFWIATAIIAVVKSQNKMKELKLYYITHEKSYWMFGMLKKTFKKASQRLLSKPDAETIRRPIFLFIHLFCTCEGHKVAQEPTLKLVQNAGQGTKTAWCAELRLKNSMHNPTHVTEIAKYEIRVVQSTHFACAWSIFIQIFFPNMSSSLTSSPLMHCIQNIGNFTARRRIAHLNCEDCVVSRALVLVNDRRSPIRTNRQGWYLVRQYQQVVPRVKFH